MSYSVDWDGPGERDREEMTMRETLERLRAWIARDVPAGTTSATHMMRLIAAALKQDASVDGPPASAASHPSPSPDNEMLGALTKADDLLHDGEYMRAIDVMRAAIASALAAGIKEE